MNFKKIGSKGGKNTAGDAINLEITFKNSALNISTVMLCRTLKIMMQPEWLLETCMWHCSIEYTAYISPQISSVSFTFLSHGFPQKPWKPTQIDEGQPWWIQNSLHWTTFNQREWLNTTFHPSKGSPKDTLYRFPRGSHRTDQAKHVLH